jgi:hypothetical protein
LVLISLLDAAKAMEEINGKSGWRRRRKWMRKQRVVVVYVVLTKTKKASGGGGPVHDALVASGR